MIFGERKPKIVVVKKESGLWKEKAREKAPIFLKCDLSPLEHLHTHTHTHTHIHTHHSKSIKSNTRVWEILHAVTGA
jgi:hypothetical protein